MKNCIFCKIASGEIPTKKIYEDGDVIAFPDREPKTPGHTLLIPKEHHVWFQDLPDKLSDHLFRIAKSIAKELKAKNGADYVHLSIVGKDVPHVHVHLMPRKLGDKLPSA